MTSQTILVSFSLLSLGDSFIEMTYDVLFLLICLRIIKMVFALATAWLPDKVHVKVLKTLDVLRPLKESKEPPCRKEKDH